MTDKRANSDRPPPAGDAARRELRRWRITGQVQGVGFRPFVYRLAHDLGLSGSVRNDPAGVSLEAWAEAAKLDEFIGRIRAEAPALARIEAIEQLHCPPPPPAPQDQPEFEIVGSDHRPQDRGRVTVDSAVCADCLRELFDEDDRRFGHALINCTNCGPRYTIVRDLPYDRPKTTMAGFEMCRRCRREYEAPADRRFHAQPVCCPDCGPQLKLTDREGLEIAGDPIAGAAEILRAGGIVGMKGLGGYHLVVDADNEDAVQRLREGKKRDHKPFAIMVKNPECARDLVVLSPEAEALIGSPICPIVLALRRDSRPGQTAGRPSVGHTVARSVATACHRLGMMLPNTPMQHLLMAQIPRPLVMTSANLSDDPLLKDDEEARQRLGKFCNVFLTHDRPIERAVDDSIIMDTPRGLIPLRRARGYAPAPLSIPFVADEPGLCAGAELKNTVAVVRRGEVILSQHIGDLTYSLAYKRFEKTIDDLTRLWETAPRWVACDKHPQYLSQRFARHYAVKRGIDLVYVQHHHAHMAALMAEHGLTERIVCVICDGVGYGDDGTAWGGEVFIGDLARYRRIARMRPLRLPGGDAAAKEIGRCAVSWLFDLLGEVARDHPLTRRVIPYKQARDMIFKMLNNDINCPPSSGLGRLFDAAASILEICNYNHHEAMSGMRLESAAEGCRDQTVGDDLIAVDRIITEAGESLIELDHRPLLDRLLSELAQGRPVEDLAFLFHDALARALSRAATHAAEETGIDTVGLTGGVFCNGLLTRLVADRLDEAGLRPLLHRQVPPNDGAIAYGQAAVVAACQSTGNN
ncbi:MAG: carbamoyltransferase HypF [Phycisphaerales bacterium]|nr:MAG: carbamoyltransferase HypF [Phycisphaerales bacterium]